MQVFIGASSIPSRGRNLAGEVDFYGRSEENCDFARISKCEANCTVSAEWAPDGGRHTMIVALRHIHIIYEI